MGDYRRQLCGAVQPAQWYDPNNVQGMTARTMACDAALTDLLEYMKLPGVRVSAFDATNSTKERRKHIVDVLKMSGLGVKYMFVESICDEEDVRCTVLEHGFIFGMLSSFCILHLHILNVVVSKYNIVTGGKYT